MPHLHGQSVQRPKTKAVYKSIATFAGHCADKLHRKSARQLPPAASLTD